MPTRRLMQAMLLLPLLCVASTPFAEEWTVDGGAVTWRLAEDSLAALGVELIEAPADVSASRSGGTLRIQGSKAILAGYGEGGLLFTGGPVLSVAGERIDLSVFRIVMEPSDEPTLALSDLEGARWFRLVMGQHWLEQDRALLQAQFMEIRPHDELARRLGKPAVKRVYLGELGMTADIIESEAFLGSEKRLCRDPVWPDEQNDVDVLMLQPRESRQGAVAETYVSQGRANGVVYLTPAADFRIVGSADVPWYFRYVTPETDPAGDCLDDGTGQCQPYGEPAGGYLVWAVYRQRSDGLLVQVARSGLKHAFNSINSSSSSPDFTCACLGNSRVAFSGCEDLYSISTNADRDVLGARAELEPFRVTWDSCGSTFDRDCDGQCDISLVSEFSQQNIFPCIADVDRPWEFQAAVPEATMNSTDPLFIESWYVVRDDVDVLNSMGVIEFSREFVESGDGGIWVTEQLGDFTNGPTLARLAAKEGRELARLDSGSGLILVDGQRESVDSGRTRFSYSIMNVDHGPGVRSVTIPFSNARNTQTPFFLDGDDDESNDWVTKTTDESIIFKALPGAQLTWGALVTFGFEANRSSGGGEVLIGLVEGAEDKAVQLPEM